MNWFNSIGKDDARPTEPPKQRYCVRLFSADGKEFERWDFVSVDLGRGWCRGCLPNGRKVEIFAGDMQTIVVEELDTDR